MLTSRRSPDHEIRTHAALLPKLLPGELRVPAATEA